MRASEVLTLGNLATEITVGFVGSMASEYMASGVPFLRSLNVEALSINPKDMKFISPEFHARLSKSSLKPGDVVVVRTGKPGAASVIPEWLSEANCSDLVIIRPGPELNPHWLAYYINTVAASHVSAHLVGAVQQHFNVQSAKMIPLPDPMLSRKQQDSIAQKLRLIDRKIELNIVVNRTLESMAKAIFREWFINFGPVKAKAEGKKPFGIDDKTAALFPDSFEESEFGLIPSGWKVGQLRDICSVVGGYAFKSSDFSKSGHAVVKIKNISDSLSVDLTDVDYVTKDVANRVPKFHLKDGSLVMAMTGATVGKYGLVLSSDELSPVLNQRVALIVPKGKNFGFLLSALLTTDIYSQVVNRAEGSAQPNISADGIMDSKVIVPSQEVQDSFSAMTNYFFNQWNANKKESLLLEETRNLLLPKLISGEMGLKDQGQNDVI